MKMSNTLKVLLSSILLSMSVAASASTVTPTGMAMTLAMGDQANYGNTDLDGNGLANVILGDSLGNGFDRWQITLTQQTNLLINFVTGQDTTLPYSYLDKATLSDGTSSWTQMAVIAGPSLPGISTIQMSVANLAAGIYNLDIYGDTGLGYSGSVSAVPLPAAAWLFGSALLGFGALRRKQKAGNSEMAVA